MSGFEALAQQCAPAVHPATMAAVVRVESTFNPFAIGVVGGRLQRQPRTMAEAVVTARALEAAGYNFSVGIGQVNRHNLAKFGLDYQTAFEPCVNLKAASLILKDCYDRAKVKKLDGALALQAAFSCYYSGNFSTGFRSDTHGQPSYVQRILISAAVRDDARVPMTGVAPVVNQTFVNARGSDAVQVKAGLPEGPSVATGYRTASDSVLVYR
jgi:type IV secretion system protein VirB1